MTRRGPGRPFPKGHIPANKKEPITLVCTICGANFTVIPSRRGTAKCCSAHCARIFASRSRPPEVRRKNAEAMVARKKQNAIYRFVNKSTGYVLVPGETGDWVYEHRLVMEQHLGRKLASHEVVHHIDGNPGNNALENLIVLTRSTHIVNHALQRKRWARGFDSCFYCGRSDRPHNAHGLCQTCYKRWEAKRRGHW